MSRSALVRQMQRQKAAGTLPSADPFEILQPYLPDDDHLARAMPVCVKT